MLGFYTRMGFRDTSVKVREHMYDGEMLVLLGDMSTLKGKHVSPIIWNLVWRPAYEHLAHVGLTEAVGVDALRIRIYKFLSPLSWVFSKAIGLRNIKTKKKK